jgi:hypothetical protein
LVKAADTVEAHRALDSLVGQLGQAALADGSTEGQWAAALHTLPSRPQLLAAAQLAAGRVARQRQLQLQLQTAPDGSDDLASAIDAALEVRGRGRGGLGVGGAAAQLGCHMHASRCSLLHSDAETCALRCAGCTQIMMLT